MRFAEFARERRRLAAPRLLAEAPSYSHDDALLRAGREAVGHAVHGDALRGELAARSPWPLSPRRRDHLTEAAAEGATLSYGARDTVIFRLP